MSKYSTTGGVPTKNDAYTKLIWHLSEAIDQAALLGHLHKTESSKMDGLVGQGWLGVSELLLKTRNQITKLAASKFN
jgi:hypothetical protein